MSQGSKSEKRNKGRGSKGSKNKPDSSSNDAKIDATTEVNMDFGAEDKTITKLNKVMADNSSTAKTLRQNITDRLDSLEKNLHNKTDSDSEQSTSLSATNEQVKQLLEITIKEKLADLEEAVRGKSAERETSATASSNSGSLESLEKTSNGKVDSEGKRTPKEKSPEAIASVQEVHRPKVEPVAKAEVDYCCDGAFGECKRQAIKVSTPSKKSQKAKSSVDNVMKSLTSCETDSEKLVLLSKKHIDLLDENRTLEQQVKQHEKMSSQLLREHEQLQSEHNRSVLAKSKLENLCRELQRQNKAIKEESLSRIKEEEEKRRDIAGKFQSTFNEIMTLVQENQKRNELLKDENQELAQKLKQLMTHYDNWEKNIEKIIQQKDLESQLVKAKLAKTNLLLQTEKEQSLEEKKQLIEMVTELQKRTKELTANEIRLRAELSMYTLKYEEFQGILTRSNDTFSSFKKDMEKMSKQIKKLEKETNQWKAKWEISNKALIELSEEKLKRDTELHEANQKAEKLDKLCRALQDERTKMLSQIKELKIVQ
ncbi:Alpha-taxilin [Halotydeus destructor]|nr:Alpha-taxilin [Halotydeus destructor]